MTAPTSNVRLFFALWPDVASVTTTAALAQQVALKSAGRAVPTANIHLTLAFLGHQPQTSIASIMQAVAGIEEPAFDLGLDRLDYWRKVKVAWLGTDASPPELAALNRRIVASLSDVGIKSDDRPYHPHVTLARKATVPISERLERAIAWRIADFSLVASVPGQSGSTYRRLAQWPLRTRTG